MRELVLTGYKDFWPEEEKNALFLGPWCFSDNHKYKFWAQDKFSLSASPWEDSNEMLKAALYIDSLSDKIIRALTPVMNRFQKYQRSEKFWKMYMVVWLIQWLNIYYDRYRRIAALKNMHETFTVKIACESEYPVSNPWDFFEKAEESHGCNLFLMSDIIRNAGFDFLKYTEIKTDIGVSGNKTGRQDGLFSKISKAIEPLYGMLKSYKIELFNSYPVYLGHLRGISSIDRFYLQSSLDPIFFLRPREKVFLKILKRGRGDLLNSRLELGAENEFEKMVEKALLKYIPEEFTVTYEAGRDYHSKIKAWIGVDIYISPNKAFRVASVVENGGRYIGAQHGGGYGQLKSISHAKMEYETSSEYITWGWNFKHIYDSRYQPLPSPQLSKLKSYKCRSNNLVFVGTVPSAYKCDMHSFLSPEQLLAYFHNKEIFLKRLKLSIIPNIRYRPYFKDYGSGEREFVKSILPDMRLLTDVNLTDAFSRSRLVVMDHLTTGYLEALSMNVPTIIFCNPDHFVMADIVKPFFDKLRNAGILYDNAEEAANKVNGIWDDVRAWWEQESVQRPREEFCRYHARASKSWRREWIAYLKDLKQRID